MYTALPPQFRGFFPLCACLPTLPGGVADIRSLFSSVTGFYYTWLDARSLFHPAYRASTPPLPLQIIRLLEAGVPPLNSAKTRL